ncbi:MAG: glyceraldehyde 3-phosphate dehydrogenase NAD-binding domain-containing protein [Gammaproteobacteria bacterium]|nr:erythrose-4-phosphate dehydrogenase [Pseudomonadales bacterium]MCP5347838.1 erythrose-4-phosphate dehydrogenase [Pseudomonadales bacterium]
MAYRIAINGLGRIGRCVLRALYEATDYPQLRIVAVNDLADIGTLAHLLRYDSTHGRFLGEVRQLDGALEVAGDRVQVFQSADPDQLPWNALAVDLVMECSGTFSDRETATRHLRSGARRVLFSQPAERDVDATLVFGINHETLTGRETVLSNASCTTNAIIPVVRALHESLGITNGVITTIHSAMNDQPVIDAYHHSDLRKTRSAMQSIIPVETEIARGIGRILPDLAGRFEAYAVRVPTVNVSAIDLTLVTGKPCDAAAINALIRAESQRLAQNILGYTEEPLASCDFNHDPRSAIVDLSFTRVSGSNLVKLLIWFDNEWAYANRMLDVAQYLAQLDERSGAKG